MCIRDRMMFYVEITGYIKNHQKFKFLFWSRESEKPIFTIFPESLREKIRDTEISSETTIPGISSETTIPFRTFWEIDWRPIRPLSHPFGEKRATLRRAGRPKRHWGRLGFLGIAAPDFFRQPETLSVLMIFEILMIFLYDRYFQYKPLFPSSQPSKTLKIKTARSKSTGGPTYSSFGPLGTSFSPVLYPMLPFWH